MTKMNDDQLKDFCLKLIKADWEEEIIGLLKKENFWDNPNYWRYYGDIENNWSNIGNQQSRPEAALVEKIVNSIDARLINECLKSGIDPEGSNAPQTIKEAVALFFNPESKPNSIYAGQINEWSDQKRTKIAKGITVTVTGATPGKGSPCFTISDLGEGQIPDNFPDTFVSLNRANKFRIPFVQGKYNMGGTGVLKFAGENKLQLIVSRRNPNLISSTKSNSRVNCWGFTIVRRETGGNSARSSIFKYLAPVEANSNPGKGKVLFFQSKSMPIFPEGKNAYARESEWGTLIKLYEFALDGSKTHILRKNGLLNRLETCLPELALPVRMHECRREYKGHEGSFDTNLTGLNVRLGDGTKNENLEPDFPDTCSINVRGENMKAKIYAFKKDRSKAYRKNEGIIFSVNGQTHGHYTTDFFRRKKVNLSYLADSIFMIVDCSEFSVAARENLFMNSRDRLSGGPFRKAIEEEFIDVLRNHEGLRALWERRRSEDIESKLQDDKPFLEILESVISNNPTLSSLFLKGDKLKNPFKSKKIREKENDFVGKKFPTFFKFQKRDYGSVLARDCHLNMRARISFETDVQNDFLDRTNADECGTFILDLKNNLKLGKCD
ncbi:hypothetical protein UR09_06820, partial [Candidatus Nitromaritima sp. SCGC AAA799-A02]